MGIPLYARESLLKYSGGLHSYLRHAILMFNPSNIDEVSVQATHLEASKGKYGMDDAFAEPRSKKTITMKEERPTCSHSGKGYKE